MNIAKYATNILKWDKNSKNKIVVEVNYLLRCGPGVQASRRTCPILVPSSDSSTFSVC